MEPDKIQDLKRKKRRSRKAKVSPMLAPPALETTEARESYETTVAYRLQVALHEWTCDKCKANRPGIYKTDGRIRYVRCRRCGADGKIVI